MIYSPRAQPEVNESHVHDQMAEVLDLWRKTMENNCHVFNLSNCLVVFKM